MPEIGWWQWPARLLVETAGRAAEAVGRCIPRRLLATLDRLLSDGAVQARLDRAFCNAADPLLAGRPRDFAQSQWSLADWPTLYMDIPADVRRPVLWDGRVLGGAPASWLAWRHFTPAVPGAAARAGARAGIAWALAVGLLLLAIAAGRTALDRSVLHDYPQWAVEAGVSAPVLWWYVERIAGTLVGSGGSFLLTLVAGISAGAAAAYFAAGKVLADWWEEAGRPLRTPTQDNLFVHDARADVRSGEYLAYVRQVQAAAGRLATQPLLPIGRATGTFRARGDMESPVVEQLMALDGESIRHHVLALGAPGLGKTRLVLQPLFSKVMAASWGIDHHIGAMVLDGKGTLWRELTPIVAHRNDVRVIGTGEGQQGVDLLAGMAPTEVAATLKAVSGQVTIGAEARTWTEPATLLAMHAATLCAALDLDASGLHAWQAMGFRPWSLIGITEVACSPQSQRQAILRLLALRQAPADSLTPELREALAAPDLAAALHWLEDDWSRMVDEIRAGCVAAVAGSLGGLADAGALRERFATGLCQDTTDVSHALGGGVVMVAVGEAEWGMAGRAIACWLKSRLFSLARKKLEANRGRFRDTSIALFVDDLQTVATAGPDGDDAFCSIARETGVFLVAATRSLAALRGVMGEAAADNLLSTIETKIVLQTEEPEILDYLVTLAGELPVGPASADGIPETQAARELAIPDVAPPIPTGMGATRWGCVPRRVPLTDDRGDLPVGLAERQRLGRSAGGKFAFWKRDGKVELAPPALVRRPKLSPRDLLLGEGLAFAVVQRAGAERADIVDLTGMPT